MFNFQGTRICGSLRPANPASIPRIFFAVGDIRPYRALFHYSLLLITLSEAKQTPQSRLCRAGSPAGGAEKQANEVRPYGRNNKFCEDFVPLTRQRCVESPHPTSCVSINLYRLHGRRYPLIPRTFSLFTFTYYFERSETPSTGEPK